MALEDRKNVFPAWAKNVLKVVLILMELMETSIVQFATLKLYLHLLVLEVLVVISSM